MQKVSLGQTGERVSQVALGCMLMGSTIDRAA
jgi:aryl-alcohol dehydrogenase-like predicted oxidoreductase